MLKRTITLLAIILALLGGGYYYQHNTANHNKPAQTTNTAETKNLITVKFEVTNNDLKSSRVFKIKKDSTVLSLMQLAQKEHNIKFTSSTSSYGVLIDSINGVANDSAAKKYWSYYINGKMAAQGVGTQKLSPNDTVEWKYEALSL